MINEKFCKLKIDKNTRPIRSQTLSIILQAISIIQLTK